MAARGVHACTLLAAARTSSNTHTHSIIVIDGVINGVMKTPPLDRCVQTGVYNLDGCTFDDPLKYFTGPKVGMVSLLSYSEGPPLYSS